MSRQKESWSFQDTSLKRSFLWSLAITALPVVSGFVVSWVIARWAGPRVVGTVSWVMSFATAVLIIGKFGLDLAASRLASEFGVGAAGSLRALFRTAIQLRLLFTCSVALLAWVFSPRVAGFFDDTDLTGPIRVGALVVVCASLYEFKENFLIGLNRLQTVYRIRAVHLLLRVLVTCVLVFLGLGATQILGGYCAAWAVAIAVYVAMLMRFLPVEDAGPAREGLARRLLVLSVPLAVSSASVTIYSHMDRLMLGYFSGIEEVGQYAVARNISEVSLFPVFALIMMLRPALASRFSGGDVTECAAIIRRSLRFSLVSGVLFAAIFAVFGLPLVTAVFSRDFSHAGGLMIFFAGVIVFRSIGAVILPSLVAAERTRVYAYLTAASAVLNFALNLVLIPKYQARGAVIATLVSYGVLLIVGLHEVFVTYGVRLSGRSVSLGLRTILAGSLAAGIVWPLRGRTGLEWEAFLWAGVLTVAYALLAVAFRVARAEDIRVLLINLRKSKG
ncbi:MAG: flippase [Candidatus Krumholzibacteria bacterium]